MRDEVKCIFNFYYIFTYIFFFVFFPWVFFKLLKFYEKQQTYNYLKFILINLSICSHYYYYVWAHIRKTQFEGF